MPQAKIVGSLGGSVGSKPSAVATATAIRQTFVHSVWKVFLLLFSRQRMGLPRRPLRLCPSRKYSLTESGNCSTHFNEIVERKWSNVKNYNNLLSPVWIQSIVISDFVCLPVRDRDDREHYSRNYMPDHHKCMQRACEGRCLVFHWRSCDTLCTSSYVDDMKWGRKSAYRVGQKSKLLYCDRYFKG